MPPSTASKARPQRDKRELIMSAALKLFVERGFYGTAVPEIAEHAGVGAGTIYRYFDSKEALVNAVYREHKLAFGNYVMASLPKGASFRELFHQLWQRMVAFAVDNPSSLVFLELHHHAPYLDADSRAVEHRITDLIGGVITAAQARGELKRGDPTVLMSLVMGAFVGMIRGCVGNARPLGEADWELTEQCMWEAIRV